MPDAKTKINVSDFSFFELVPFFVVRSFVRRWVRRRKVASGDLPGQIGEADLTAPNPAPNERTNDKERDKFKKGKIKSGE